MEGLTAFLHRRDHEIDSCTAVFDDYVRGAGHGREVLLATCEIPTGSHISVLHHFGTARIWSNSIGASLGLGAWPHRRALVPTVRTGYSTDSKHAHEDVSRKCI